MPLFSLRCLKVSKASFSTFVVLLSVVVIASGQTGRQKPLPTEPLEKYDDPPAPSSLWGIGVSPGNGTVTTTSGTTIDGTLAPTGQLTINGALTFSGTIATMECHVVPASADNVNLSGVASLAGKISVTMTGTTFTAGTTYTLLHAAGTVSGRFPFVSIKPGTGDCFTPVITYDAHNVYLYLEPCSN
jgi:hypothetical protein